MALPIENSNKTHVLTTHIVLWQDIQLNQDEFLRDIITKCESVFDRDLLPIGFKIRDDMPVGPTHKRDINRLAQDYAGYRNIIDGKLVDVIIK